MVSFFILEVVPMNPRGGNWDNHILQHETLWIEHLNALTPPGLNEANSYKPFFDMSAQCAFVVLCTSLLLNISLHTLSLFLFLLYDDCEFRTPSGHPLDILKLMYYIIYVYQRFIII